MTAQRSFKRLVRARMDKTGESYTAARAQLLAATGKAPDEAYPHLVCPDGRIRERTGRGWEEWFDLIDSWDGESMGHTDLARRVAEVLDAPLLAWNTQAVTTSFERSRGKRQLGERVGRDGLVAGASKTIGVPAEQAFLAFVDPSFRAGWLPQVELSERTVTKPTSARFDVGDGPTRLKVTVAVKDPAKCTVAVEESRLAGPDDRAARKVFWREALTELKAQLERDAAAPPP